MSPGIESALDVGYLGCWHSNDGRNSRRNDGRNHAVHFGIANSAVLRVDEDPLEAEGCVDFGKARSGEKTVLSECAGQWPPS